MTGDSEVKKKGRPRKPLQIEIDSDSISIIVSDTPQPEVLCQACRCSIAEKAKHTEAMQEARAGRIRAQQRERYHKLKATKLAEDVRSN